MHAHKQQSLPTFRQAGPIFPPTAILFSAPRLPYLISRSNCVLLEFHNSPQTHLSDTFHSIILQLQYNQPPNSWIISTSLQPILKFQQKRLTYVTHNTRAKLACKDISQTHKKESAPAILVRFCVNIDSLKSSNCSSKPQHQATIKKLGNYRLKLLQ